MADLSVEIGGVKFKNPIVVGSATPTMDAIRMKHGIDGGAGAVIAKSLFGEKFLGANPKEHILLLSPGFSLFFLFHLPRFQVYRLGSFHRKC